MDAAAASPARPAIRFRRCRRSAMTRARTSGHRSRPERSAGSALSRATRWCSRSSSARQCCTTFQMLPGRGVAGLAARLPQAHQGIHGQMRHAATSSPSQRRSRTCARASCDLEKLGVLPIIAAISSWVYPSTSCSQTTAREVSRQPLERRLEIHPERGVLPPAAR